MFNAGIRMQLQRYRTRKSPTCEWICEMARGQEEVVVGDKQVWWQTMADSGVRGQITSDQRCHKYGFLFANLHICK